MKNFAKILFVSVLSLGFGVAAQAQTATNTLGASATIVDQLAVAQEADLKFGIVMQGVNKMINLVDGTSASSGVPSTSNIGTGRFLVNAGAGSSVTLKVEVPANLLKGSVTMPIAFNENALGAPATTVGFGPAPGSVTKLNVGAAGNSITFPSDVINSKTGTYVYVGGVVKPASDQENGAYIGTVTLTATYN
jgi:hypothetical protein